MKRSACALAVVVLTLGVALSSPAVADESPDYRAAVAPMEIADVVGDYLIAVAYDEAVARAAELDAWLATLYEPPVVVRARASTPSYSGGGGGVGECTGFSVPDYVIQRESGGSMTAHNASGAHGCTQTLLSHYSGGSCAGLDPYTLDGQRQCTWILSDGGTNLAPWAATR